MKQVSDIDIHLYLSDALSGKKKFIFKLMLMVDSDLRQRLRELEAEKQEFMGNEFQSVKSRLFPDYSFKEEPSSPQGFQFNFALKAAVTCGLVAIICLPLMQEPATTTIQFTAKGSNQNGYQVMLKSTDQQSIVDSPLSIITSSDTIQIIPNASEKPYFAMYSWDSKDGLSKIFPSSSSEMIHIDNRNLPPALTLKDPQQVRLICISGNEAVRLSSLEELIKEKKINTESTENLEFKNDRIKIKAIDFKLK